MSFQCRISSRYAAFNKNANKDYPIHALPLIYRGIE
jgi:hypothetical protein